MSKTQNQRIQKGTPNGVPFRALRARSPAAFCLQQSRQDRRYRSSAAFNSPVKVQLCRTFIPLPVPRRHGLVRRADERGISPLKFLRNLGAYLRGTASPLESASACLARRPGHIPSGKNVEMQMEHALTRLFSDVGDHAEAVHAASPWQSSGDDLKAVRIRSRCWTRQRRPQT